MRDFISYLHFLKVSSFLLFFVMGIERIVVLECFRMLLLVL